MFIQVSDWYVGRQVPIEEPLGREVRRWRVRGSRPPKRLRLLDRGSGEWAVMAHIGAAQIRVYPSRAQAEDVCARLMRADGDRWAEIDLPAQWWA